MTARLPAIDALLSPWNRNDAPGTVVAVARKGSVIHAAGYGMADLRHGIALDTRTVMRIGSQTKQFTVLLALMLERDGKLSMGDDVRRYLPWLPAYPAPVTLQHMADNQSGLRDFLQMMSWSGLPLAGPSTRATAREIIGRHAEVNFPPGEQMVYCNTGFFLLSEILEEVSGRSYNELLAERITGPTGMADSRLMARDAEVHPRLADHHVRGPSGGWERAQWGLALGGEGGMISTVEDMLRWQAHLAAPDAGMAPLLARMTHPAKFNHGGISMYGNGLVMAPYRGRMAAGHGGGVAGGLSQSTRFIDDAVAIVVLGNQDLLQPFPTSRRIADIVLDGVLAPRPDPAEMAALAAGAGLYREVDSEDLFELVPAGDGVMFVSAGSTAPVEHVGPGVFAPEAAVVHLTFGMPKDGVIAAKWCGLDKRYVRLLEPPASAPDITGAYVNPALGLDAVVRREDGQLRLVIRSDFGAIRLRLDWLDGDLLMARAHDAPQARAVGVPWTGAVRVGRAGLFIDTPRTKRLTLARTR